MKHITASTGQETAGLTGLSGVGWNQHLRRIAFQRAGLSKENYYHTSGKQCQTLHHTYDRRPEVFTTSGRRYIKGTLAPMSNQMFLVRLSGLIAEPEFCRRLSGLRPCL